MSGSRARLARQKASAEVSGEEPPVDLIDGIPHIPDEEADLAVDEEARRWPELMRRLAE